MSANPHWVATTDADEVPTAENLSSINAVFGLSLIILQAASPAQAMRLVTTAVPSIAHGHTAVAWHSSSSGDYYQRAPAEVRSALSLLSGPSRIRLEGFVSSWAFPLAASRGREPVFLVARGDTEMREQETFLLSVLVQTCATVITNYELGIEVGLRAQADHERDLAQARAAELAISEQRQRAVLAAALDAVVSVDQHARVTYINSAFQLTFGYQADEVIGRDLADVIVPPSLRDAHRRGFARYLTTGEAHILDRRLEVTAMRADGSEFAAEVAITSTGLPGEPSFTGYIRDITERRRVREELLASRVRLVTASDAARRRITRDLHDGAQQRFVTTLINLQIAEQKWGTTPQRSKELLRLAINDTRRGIEDLREIVAGIHPAILTQRGLGPALRSLASGLPLPVEVDAPEERLSESVEASVYLFCAEGLTNVVKHAHATFASVHIEMVERNCLIELCDDGVGGAAARSDSSGLTGLRDRVGALNGTMDVFSPISGGTVLSAVIPRAGQ